MCEQPMQGNISVESYQRLEELLQKVRMEALNRAIGLAAEDNPGKTVFCITCEHIDAAIEIALNRKKGG